MHCWDELKKLKRSKCRGQCVEVMAAIFRICGNESQPGLQLVKSWLRHFRELKFSFNSSESESFALSQYFVGVALSLRSATSCQTSKNPN